MGSVELQMSEVNSRSVDWKIAVKHVYHIYSVIRLSLQTTKDVEVSFMLFSCNIEFLLPKQSQRTRSILEDWDCFRRENLPSYN